MAEKFIVKEKSKILDFLFLHLKGWSKKTIKQRLQSSSILVNNEFVNKHDYMVKENDIVEVSSNKKISVDTLKKLEIIYQDKDLIAINKPAGLLSVSSTSEPKQHALYILKKQLSTSKNEIKLWPVHRLDRDTSGILLFATSKEIREKVMDKWNQASKTYLAIVEGKVKKKKDTINQPLRLDEKIYKMHVGKHKDAKTAISHYELIKSGKKRTLLEVNIETGRQHQIRAHLSWMGNAIVGDERYGKEGDRMALHSKKLIIIHPRDNKEITFTIDAPKEFYLLLT